MKNIVFALIVLLFVSCKNEIYLLFDESRNSGLVLDKKDHRYYYKGGSHGNWIKKGKYIILNSDLDPEKIEKIALDVSNDSSSNLIITSKFAQTGAIPNNVTIFLYNKKGVREVELSARNKFFTIPKDSFNYDSISIMMPIWYETYKYAFSNKIPVQIGDTVSISIWADAFSNFEFYFNNRAFIKKGNTLVDPFTLEKPYVYY